MTKENDGNAAKLRLHKRIAVFLSFQACILGMTFLHHHHQLVHHHVLPQDDLNADDNPYRGKGRSLSEIEQTNMAVNRPSVRGSSRMSSLPNNHKEAVVPLPPLYTVETIDASTPLSSSLWTDILSAQATLVDLVTEVTEREIFDEAAGLYAVFCRVDWTAYKQDPSLLPMFSDIVGNSTDCQTRRTRVPWKLLMERIRGRDDTETTHVLDLSAVVFHESHCGSTLAANLLSRWDPSAHRVYAEAPAPLKALSLICEAGALQCHKEFHMQLIKDTVYLLSRTSDPLEKRVFFKLQPEASLALPLFRVVFPDTPVLYLYRDPTQILVSQFQQAPAHAPHMAICAQSQKHRASYAPELVDVALRHAKDDEEEEESDRNVDPAHLGINYVAHMPATDFCAAQLASFAEAGAKAVQQDPLRSHVVNYNRLPDALWEEVLPPILGVESVTPKQLERLRATAVLYSKRRIKNHEGDSEQESVVASPEIQHASAVYLQNSYQTLEKLQAEGMSRLSVQ